MTIPVMKNVTFLLLAAILLLGAPTAQAHCDTVDGPVAMAVSKALETGNVNLVLPYAPASAEKELREAFAQARQVRTLGPDARALADRSFLETAIRLHRAGEGAPYTGLKPAGHDFGPVIPAAEHAVETGDLSRTQGGAHEGDRARSGGAVGPSSRSAEGVQRACHRCGRSGRSQPGQRRARICHLCRDCA